jgi:hypothetical protein
LIARRFSGLSVRSAGPFLFQPNAKLAVTVNSDRRASLRRLAERAQGHAMLHRPKGATVDEIAKALSWQPHTVRGAIAGALKKKLGLDVTSEKDDTRGRVYHIAC